MFRIGGMCKVEVWDGYVSWFLQPLMRIRCMRRDVAPGGFHGPPRSASETHMFIAFPYGDLQLKEFWTLTESSTRASEGTKQESSPRNLPGPPRDLQELTKAAQFPSPFPVPINIPIAINGDGDRHSHRH